MSLSREDLEKQNEVNLLGLLNSAADSQVRLYAAVLLYKRGSRFLAFEEWQKYKNEVLDYLLQERAAAAPRPFAPNVSEDLAGRLHSRISDAHQSVSQAHEVISQHAEVRDLADGSIRQDVDKNREEYLKALADHDKNLVNHTKNIETIQDNADLSDTYFKLKLIDVNEKIRNLDADVVALGSDVDEANEIFDRQITSLTNQFTAYKKSVRIASASLLGFGLVVSYLIHHFLR